MKYAVLLLLLGTVACAPRLSSDDVHGVYSYSEGLPGEQLTLGLNGQYDHVWRAGREKGVWRLRRDPFDDCDMVEIRDFTLTSGGRVDRRNDIFAGCVSRDLLGRTSITVQPDEGIYLTKLR